MYSWTYSTNFPWNIFHKISKDYIIIVPFSVFFFKWILIFLMLFIRNETYLFPVFFLKWILMLLIPFYTQWDVFVFSYLFQVNFNAYNAFYAQWDIFVCLLFICSFLLFGRIVKNLLFSLVVLFEVFVCTYLYNAGKLVIQIQCNFLMYVNRF